MTDILDNIIRKPWRDFSKDKESKLLTVDDWSKITPAQLRQYIADGYIVDWFDGYDAGPGPLTDALMADAGLEIIALLIGGGANVNVPTVLPDGTKMTPLEIVRSQAPSHQNMQKELMLLRAGATDDVWAWLQNDKRFPPTYWAGITHIGIWCGYNDQCAYRIFRAEPVLHDEYGPYYIVEQAGKFAWIKDSDADGGEVFYEPESFGHSWTDEAKVRNELGDVFAKQFLAEVENLSFNVAMYKYYEYMSSAHIHNGCESDRIPGAIHDLRDRYFTADDWDELIRTTPNITARAEYSKMKKKHFHNTKQTEANDDK